MLYKIVQNDGSVYHHDSDYRWPLPTRNEDGTWTPGEWTPEIEGELVPCVNGYHLCREQDLLNWLGPAIFEAEYRGECVEAGNKIVVRQARLLRRCEGWNERTARLFACDCAEHVLSIFERAYPDDMRPREAIEVARRYADGEVTSDDLAAAKAAVWAAVWAAAGDAARYADRYAAGKAAAAARAAAGAAAWDAAGAAASAAWDAAAAARAAAGAAAWDAASAAWDAARDAERQWQIDILLSILRN